MQILEKLYKPRAIGKFKQKVKEEFGLTLNQGQEQRLQSIQSSEFDKMLTCLECLKEFNPILTDVRHQGNDNLEFLIALSENFNITDMTLIFEKCYVLEKSRYFINIKIMPTMRAVFNQKHLEHGSRVLQLIVACLPVIRTSVAQDSSDLFKTLLRLPKNEALIAEFIESLPKLVQQFHGSSYKNEAKVYIKLLELEDVDIVHSLLVSLYNLREESVYDSTIYGEKPKNDRKQIALQDLLDPKKEFVVHTKHDLINALTLSGLLCEDNVEDFLHPAFDHLSKISSVEHAIASYWNFIKQGYRGELKQEDLDAKCQALSRKEPVQKTRMSQIAMAI